MKNHYMRTKVPVKKLRDYSPYVGQSTDVMVVTMTWLVVAAFTLQPDTVSIARTLRRRYSVVTDARSRILDPNADHVFLSLVDCDTVTIRPSTKVSVTGRMSVSPVQADKNRAATAKVVRRAAVFRLWVANFDRLTARVPLMFLTYDRRFLHVFE
jgi:hypothetical protein